MSHHDIDDMLRDAWSAPPAPPRIVDSVVAALPRKSRPHLTWPLLAMVGGVVIAATSQISLFAPETVSSLGTATAPGGSRAVSSEPTSILVGVPDTAGLPDASPQDMAPSPAPRPDATEEPPKPTVVVAKNEGPVALNTVVDIRSVRPEIESGTGIKTSWAMNVAQRLRERALYYDGISRLERTSVRRAMKDLNGEIGKAILARGLVLDIVRDGGRYSGLMCVGHACREVVYFVTTGATRDILAGDRAAFAGVVLDRAPMVAAMAADYFASQRRATARGDVVVVGYFRGQQ